MSSRAWSVLSASAAVALFALMAKASGALKEVAMAKAFGTSPAVDYYVQSFTLAMLPAAVVTSVLTLALTPVLATRPIRNDNELRSFIGQLATMAVIIAAIVVVAFLAAASGIMAPPGQADSDQRATMNHLLWANGIAAFLAVPVALWTVVLASQGVHLSSLLEGVPAFVLFASLVLL